MRADEILYRWIFIVAQLCACWSCCVEVQGQSPNGSRLAPPVVAGHWVRPPVGEKAQPIWGHANGLRVGLAPMPGPRGLLRIYAPYLGQSPGRVINFIAVEPIVGGQSRRGYSELEPSRLDGIRGKRFWSVDSPEELTPRQPEFPTRGAMSRQSDFECLEVYVQIESFRSGAHPYLKLRFQSNRPHEVAIATFVHADSKPLRACVLTATMGNYARLRQLHLSDKTVLSTELWPDFDGDGFTRHKRFPLAQLSRTSEGHVLVSATSNEWEPANAEYAPGTFRGWKYGGLPAVQYWICEDPQETLQVQVNGRVKYWASDSLIPGGVSFENFELVDQFRNGQELWFGVKPREEKPQNIEQGIPKNEGKTGELPPT